jgi:hypothetical protein
MLTVLIERVRTPCMLAITSEARHGSNCEGVFVAATSRPILRGSPPHCSIHFLAAATPRSVAEVVGCIDSPARKSG